MLRRGGTKLLPLDLFQEVVFNDSRGIREAVNSRHSNFSDVVKLVQQAQRFKEWLRKQSDSTELSHNYCREVSPLDWADKLPPKALRWLIMSGAGLGIDAVVGGPWGTVTGLVLSAADTLLLDRFIKGWRPNQFIEGSLKEFLRLE